MPQRTISLIPPVGGLNKRTSFQNSPPFTTARVLNCRNRDTLGRRDRIGSRPGHVRAYTNLFNSSMQWMGASRSTTAISALVRDDFNGPALRSEWTTLDWSISGYTQTDIVASTLSTYGDCAHLENTSSSIEYNGAVVWPLIDNLDDADRNVFEISVPRWSAETSTTVRVFLRMNDSSPEPNQDCIFVEMAKGRVGTGGSIRVSQIVDGTATQLDIENFAFSSLPSILTITVTHDSTDTITVHYNGEEKIPETDLPAAEGTRFGFGISQNDDGGSQKTLVQYFMASYDDTSNVNALVSRVFAVSGGALYKQSTSSTMTAITTSNSVNLRSSGPVMGVQRGGILYFADRDDTVTAEASDGSVTTAGILTSATYTNWRTTLNLAADTLDPNRVVVITKTSPSQGLDEGVYRIRTHAADADKLQLEIDNSGTDYAHPAGGTETGVTFRIERGPKYYDPATDTLLPLLASMSEAEPAGEVVGFVPVGCKIIALWRDRIVFAGDRENPHVWYMSRQGDPNDWDYDPATEDEQRAVAGTSTQAGIIADPITAVIPWHDDYLIIACTNQLWMLPGDPALGVAIVNLSWEIGCIDSQAWCYTSDGTLVFMSRKGLYMIPPGGGSPIPVSTYVLPVDLENIDVQRFQVLLVNDLEHDGVHIYNTSRVGTPVPLEGNVPHYFVDWPTKSFWPMGLPSGHVPTAVYAHKADEGAGSVVLLGGYDGRIRKPADAASTDDGESIESYVYIGPFRLWNDDVEGTTNDIYGVLSENSGDVTYEVLVGKTPESALDNDLSYSGTWSAGLNPRDKRRARGNSAYVVIRGTS